MQKKVLVSSPSAAFGELLRLSLEESSRYGVRIVPSAEQVPGLLSTDHFDLLLLDMDLRDSALIKSIQKLQNQVNNLPVIAFPPDNAQDHPLLELLPAAVCLKKPFYLPDLIDTVDVLTGLASAKPNATANETFEKPDEIAARFVEQNLSKAVISIHKEQALLHAGKLSTPALEEITALVVRSWTAERRSDLVRYARLQATGEEILLYATPGRWQADTILVTIFLPTMQLTRVRNAVQGLSQEFFESQQKLLPIPVDSGSAPFHGVWTVGDNSLEDLPEEPDAGAPVMDLRLLELLNNAPPPDPQKQRQVSAADWLPEDELVQSEDKGFQFPWEGDRAQPAKQPAKTPAVDDTQPIPLSPGGFHPGNPPGRAALRQSYTCILVPLLPEQALSGDLASELAVWIPKFCETFGWQLDRLDIQPDHLQWAITVAPAVSPGHLVRILRQQSSLRLATRFPDMMSRVGTDFWAPGYLIVSGGQPPAAHLVDNFIRQTRQRQGLIHPK